MAHRVSTSFSNTVIPSDPDLKHRAGIPAILRAEVPDPSHLRKLPPPGPDLHRVATRCPGIYQAAVSVMHLLVRGDLEPVRPEPDPAGDIGPPPQVLQPQGREVIIDHIDDQVLTAGVTVQVKDIEDRVTAYLISRKRCIATERFKPAGFSPEYADNLRNRRGYDLVSMKILPLGIVFSPEFSELLNNFIVPANLLVDGKQHRVEGQYDPKDDSQYFGFHNGPLQVPDERTTKREGLYGSPPFRVLS